MRRRITILTLCVLWIAAQRSPEPTTMAFGVYLNGKWQALDAPRDRHADLPARTSGNNMD